MSIPLTHYGVVSALLFGLSMAGLFINRKNVIILFMCIELLLLAANTNLLMFSRYFQDMHAQVFVFFVLTIAAAEAAIGLALLIVLFRRQKNVSVEQMARLQG